MKKFTFKGVLDGFRQQVQPQMVKPEQEIPETLRPEHFQLKKVSAQHTLKHISPFSSIPLLLLLLTVVFLFRGSLVPYQNK